MSETTAPTTPTPASPGSRFDFPPATQGRIEAMGDLSGAAKVFEKILNELCAPSREHSLALIHLEQVMHWATSAIARHGVPEVKP
jgi:hypothetical protein